MKYVLLMYGYDMDLYRGRQPHFPARVIFLKAKDILSTRLCLYFSGLGKQGTWDLQSFKSFALRVSLFTSLSFYVLSWGKKKKKKKN